MCLPTGTNVTAEAISTVCRILRLAVTHQRELRRFLDECRDDLASAG